jgi:hypothetical protein
MSHLKRVLPDLQGTRARGPLALPTARLGTAVGLFPRVDVRWQIGAGRHRLVLLLRMSCLWQRLRSRLELAIEGHFFTVPDLDITSDYGSWML